MNDSTYAWIIDKDHLADEWQDPKFPSQAGTQGPSNAPVDLIRRLDEGEGYTFRMYDDDGELYYTGKGIAYPKSIGSEEFAYGPLGDFGGPNAGAVRIDWHGHPEWDCG